MSNAAIDWAKRQTGISRTAKFLLVALADMASDGDFFAFPSQQTLADLIMTSDRQVRTLLRELEAADLIQAVHRGAKGSRSGGRAFNGYALRVAPVVDGARAERVAGTELPVSLLNAHEETGTELPETPPVERDLPEVLPRVTGSFSTGYRKFPAAHIEEPIEPNEPKLAAADACAPNVAPIAGGDARQMLAWFDRLVEVAGPGLSDPKGEGALHATAGELASWARSGVDLEADAVPVIRDKTRAPRKSPIRTWGLFRDDVLAARDRRIALHPIRTLEPMETADGQRRHDSRSARQRSDDAVGAGMLAALQRRGTAGGSPADGGGAPGAHSRAGGALRIVGASVVGAIDPGAAPTHEPLPRLAAGPGA